MRETARAFNCVCREAHGNVALPLDYSVPGESERPVKLGRWIAFVRRAHSTKPGTISDERVALLDAVDPTWTTPGAEDTNLPAMRRQGSAAPGGKTGGGKKGKKQGPGKQALRGASLDVSR